MMQKVLQPTNQEVNVLPKTNDAFSNLTYRKYQFTFNRKTGYFEKNKYQEKALSPTFVPSKLDIENDHSGFMVTDVRPSGKRNFYSPARRLKKGSPFYVSKVYDNGDLLLCLFRPSLMHIVPVLDIYYFKRFSRTDLDEISLKDTQVWGSRFYDSLKSNNGLVI